MVLVHYGLSLPVEAHPDMVTMPKPLTDSYITGAILLRDMIGTMTPGMSDCLPICQDAHTDIIVLS